MKKELSIFEQMGGTYTEVDGISIRILVVKPEKNVMVGKYGTIWMRFMEEKISDAISGTSHGRRTANKGSRNK